MLNLFANQPSISPSGSILYIIEGKSLTLTASGGEAPTPDEEAECPPWQLDDSLGEYYIWSDGSEGDEVSFSSSQSGPIRVKQEAWWIDAAGNDGGMTESSWSSTVELKSVKVSLSPESRTVCDGDSATFKIDVEPSTAKSAVQIISVSLQDKNGGTNFNNIKKSSITGNNFDWTVPAAYWYHTDSSDICSTSSQYQVKVKFKVHDVESEVSGNLTVKVGKNEGCWGANTAYLTKAFDGIYDNEHITLWSTDMKEVWVRLNYSEIIRSIESESIITFPSSSQFYSMVVAEENAHAQQLKGLLFPDYYSSLIFCNKGDFQIATSQFQGYYVSESTPDSAQMSEMRSRAYEQLMETMDMFLPGYYAAQSVYVYNLNQKAIERQAKDIAGASYCISYDCTYGKL
jgi:hypothetical protein